MSLDVAGFQDQGDRKYQEDSWFAYTKDNWAVIAVADGMGGHVHGGLASRHAVDSLEERLDELEEIIHSYDEATLIEFMNGLFTRINLHLIYASEPDEPEWAQLLDNRGTTFCVAVVVSDKAYFFNEGDCYGFVASDTEYQLVTVAHGEGVRVYRMLGGFTRTELEHGWGVPREITPDIFQVDLKPGEVVIVASDGIKDPDRLMDNTSLDEPNIFNAIPVFTKSAAFIAEALMWRGLDIYRGTSPISKVNADNCTVAVVKYD